MHTRFAALFLGFALVPFAWPLPSAAQITIIPGSAERGAVLVKSKGCLDCHSFDGSGQGRSPAQLAADVWNHSPEMWRAQRTKNVLPIMAARLLGIATRTIYRHLERQENSDQDNEIDDEDASAPLKSDAFNIH